MATLLITSTADSGDGTFRALLASASDGDIIQPSPSLTTCNITLATYLSIGKAVTIRGAHTRIRFTGQYFVVNTGSSTSANGKRVVLEDVDLVAMSRSATGAVSVIYTQYTEFHRCRIVGCSANATGGVYVSNSNSNTSVKFYDCAIYGGRATNTSGNVGLSFYFGNSTVSAKGLVQNCSYGGHVSHTSGTAGQFINTCPYTNAAVSTGGAAWTTPPPSGYAYSTWTSSSWESMNPRPISTHEYYSGATATDSVYDVLGNPRKSGGAVGAYEVYDLYFIGKDASGNTVSSGSYTSSVGWATSPEASVSGSTSPSSVTDVLIAANATIDGTYAGHVYVAPDTEASVDYGLTVGIGRNASVSYVVHGAVTLTEQTLVADGITIAPWSYLKLVDSTVSIKKLTIYGALITTDDLTVEKLYAEDGAFIKMADGVTLAATVDARFGDAYFEGGDVAYLFVPEGTSYGDAEFDSSVKPGYVGAGITSVAFNTGTLTWTGSNLTKPVLIQIDRDGKSKVYSNQATGGTKIINAEYQFGDSAKAIVVDGDTALQVNMPTTAPASVLDI